MTNGLRLGVLLLSLTTYDASSRDIFVSTTGNDANSGDSSSTALKTLQKAAAEASTGDVVRILPGTYHEPIRPTRSGLPGKPITYKREGSSAVVLTHSSTGGLAAGLHVEGVSHIVFDGINVDGVQPGPNAKVERFAWIREATNIVVRNCNMKYANAYSGFLVDGQSSYITLEDCTIDWNGLYDSGDAENSDWGDLVSVRGVGPPRARAEKSPVPWPA